MEGVLRGNLRVDSFGVSPAVIVKLMKFGFYSNKLKA